MKNMDNFCMETPVKNTNYYIVQQNIQNKCMAVKRGNANSSEECNFKRMQHFVP